MLLVLRSTPDNERGPRFAQQAFANLGAVPFTLLVLPIDDTPCLAIRCRESDARLIAREFQAAYPALHIEQRPGDHEVDVNCWKKTLRLSPHRFLLQSFESFFQQSDRVFTDPIGSLLHSVAVNAELQSTIAIEVRPMAEWRRWRFVWHCSRRGMENGKSDQQLFRCRLVLSVCARRRNRRSAKRKLKQLHRGLGQYTSGTPAEFKTSRFTRLRFALSDLELATLWHPTTHIVQAPHMKTNDSRELQAPLRIGTEKEPGSAVLGVMRFRETARRFAIRREDRRRHMAVVGKTGMGKSTLLTKLIGSDMQNGRGVGIVDPHGDLADDVVRLVPKRRTNDVVLLDAGDRAYPPAFNPFSCGQGDDIALTASSIVSAFKKIFGDSWGPRLENTLRNAVLALLEVPDSSFITLMQMLSDQHVRDQIVDQVRDPLIRSYWIDVFAKKSRRSRKKP